MLSVRSVASCPVYWVIESDIFQEYTRQMHTEVTIVTIFDQVESPGLVVSSRASGLKLVSSIFRPLTGMAAVQSRGSSF